MTPAQAHRVTQHNRGRLLLRRRHARTDRIWSVRNRSPATHHPTSTHPCLYHRHLRPRPAIARKCGEKRRRRRPRWRIRSATCTTRIAAHTVYSSRTMTPRPAVSHAHLLYLRTMTLRPAVSSTYALYLRMIMPPAALSCQPAWLPWHVPTYIGCRYIWSR